VKNIKISYFGQMEEPYMIIVDIVDIMYST